MIQYPDSFIHNPKIHHPKRGESDIKTEHGFEHREQSDPKKHRNKR